MVEKLTEIWVGVECVREGESLDLSLPHMRIMSCDPLRTIWPSLFSWFLEVRELTSLLSFFQKASVGKGAIFFLRAHGFYSFCPEKNCPEGEGKDKYRVLTSE